tara:strand:- start:140 stop:493 length:354 start_codon:yes stop_codon:yes gene_type:complete
MAFKLKNIYDVFGYDKEYSNGDRLVKTKPLGKHTMGQINPNGVIEISSKLNKKDKSLAVKHETEHLRQMKAGILRYDHNNYYYRKDRKSPIDVIPVSKIDTHDRGLPWEMTNPYKKK